MIVSNSWMDAPEHTSPELKRFGRYALGVLGVYMLVVLFGLTTSHTSMVFGSNDERSTIVFGQPRHERSDEFLRGSPRVIASLQEIPLRNYTPLDYTGSKKFREAQTGVLGKVVRWLAPIHEVVIGEVGKRLPISMGFSLQWWSSHVLLLLVCPLWFIQLGRSGRAGVYCALAILFAPPNAWFSNLAAFLLANAIGSVVAFLAIGRIVERVRHRKSAIPIVILLGIYAGRMAFTAAQYPPFGFPILGLIGLVSIGALWGALNRRDHRLAVVGFVVSAIVGVGLVWLHNRILYSVVLDTVYPGKRRDAGGSGGAFSWSGALSWFLQGSFARSRNVGNPEYALGPTFLIIPVLFLAIRQRGRRPIDDRLMRTPLLLGLAWLLVIMTWAQYRWPTVLVNGFNPLTWVPGSRAWQILGVLVIPALFLTLGQRSGRLERFTVGEALLSSLVVAVITGGGVNAFKESVLPEADNSVVVLSVLFSMGVTFTVLLIRSLDLRVLAMMLFLLMSSIFVNPLTMGLGAYETSDAKSTITRLAAERPQDRWATTGFYEDALMISTGVAQLSGQQPLGPNKTAWRLIDPKDRFIDNWNRGQSYINFAWDGRPDWSVWNPSGDVIQVVINPCHRKLARLRLGWVVSTQPLSFPCLVDRNVVKWMGNDLYIYERTNSSG